MAENVFLILHGWGGNKPEHWQEHLNSKLKEAGATDVREQVLKFRIAAQISPEGFWEMRSETSGTLRKKLATLSSQQAHLVAQEALHAVREFFMNDQMNFPAQMIIVTGKKRENSASV